MIFLPDNIKFRGKAYDYSVSTVDTRVIFQADLSQHSRLVGSTVYSNVNFTLDMTNDEFNTFVGWFEANNNNCFYALFPDLDYPNIDINKYYCFKFENTSLTYTKKRRYGYKVSLQLQWHYLVPPQDKP